MKPDTLSNYPPSQKQDITLFAKGIDSTLLYDLYIFFLPDSILCKKLFIHIAKNLCKINKNIKTRLCHEFCIIVEKTKTSFDENLPLSRILNVC